MKTLAFNYRDIALETGISKTLFTGFAFLFGYLLFLIPREVLAPLLIILLGIVAAILVITLIEPEDLRVLFSLFMLALGIRIFTSLFIFLLSYQYGVAEGFLFSTDAWGYSDKGWYIAQCYKWNIPIDEYYMATYVAGGSVTNYDYWCGLVYHFTGKNPLALFLINCVASSLSSIFLYSLAKRLFGRKVALFSFLLSAFWPSLIMWSTQSFKDPLIVFAIVLFFYSFIQFKEDFKIHFIPVIVLCLFVVWKLSSYTAFSLLLAVGAGILFSVRKKYFPLVIVLGLILLYCGAGYLGSKLYQLAGFEFKMSTFEVLDKYRKFRAEGNLAFFSDADLSTPFKALRFLPLGLLFAWFAPFPWQISTIQLMALPEMLLFYLLFPNLLRGMRLACRKSWGAVSSIIFFMIIMSSILALIEGNSGTLLRHRSYIIYLCFIFISVGIFRKELVASEKGKA